jgi:uncharacterized repeat protein (TIGR04076 family)
MFKVKAVVINFLGDKEKYPCHHQYKLGDEFIFDGAGFSGTICPSLALEVVPMMMNIHAAGPRYRGYIYYYPFLYAPQSVDAPELKKYDGMGYKNIFSNYSEPKYSLASLATSSTFTWPPPDTRMPAPGVFITCPDFRTSVRVKIEAFDLSDTGRNIPFFRRDMTILDKVQRKPGIEVEKILGEFTKEQIEDIYPALSQIMVKVLLEEMELMGYVETRDGKAFPTARTGGKLKAFTDSLSEDEKRALDIQY